VCAYTIALIALFFVVMTGVWQAQGLLAGGETVFMLGGWLLVAGFFIWRGIDPDYLDLQSIVKRR
jgi:hypothetical protein